MEFHHKKLIEETINSTLSNICQTLCNSTETCPNSCQVPVLDVPPPPPPPPLYVHYDSDEKNSRRVSIFLIIALSVLAATFFAVCLYVLYFRFFSGWHNSRRRSQPENEDTLDEFISEDQSRMLDHPIWYIRTTGLHQSVISSIAVCKYKKGEGLIEGTDCSVCLNEFEEDETLRLLPKCSHAFHLTCIDTWLRSHTNCPMCRAPIVTNMSEGGAPAVPILVSSSVVEETQEGIPEISVESSTGSIEDGVQELRIVVEEEGESRDESTCKKGSESLAEGEMGVIFQPRRSVSMDGLSAEKISLAIANLLPKECDGDSCSSMGRISQSQSSYGIGSKLKGSSSRARRTRSMQIGPVFMKRSFSSNGKLLLSQHIRSQKSSGHLTSF